MSLRSKHAFAFDEFAPESLVDLQALSSSPLLPSSSVAAKRKKKMQTAWKNVKMAASLSAGPHQEPASFVLSESDFPYLDAKPEVDDGFKKTTKGRRNAGDQLLQKKLAGQAFLLKQVIASGNGRAGSKVIGKKRRARLLSETSAAADDDLGLNVAYSLNRKNRWEIESAADLVRDRRADLVELSAVDRRFDAKSVAGDAASLPQERDVLALHALAQDGTLKTRASRSARGSTLAELNASLMRERENEGAERGRGDAKLGIRYVLTRAATNACAGGGKCVGAACNGGGGQSDKFKPLPRSTRRAQLDVSVYSSDGGDPSELSDSNLLSPQQQQQQPVEADETSRMYLPRQNTYTLADFVRPDKKRTMTRASHRASRHVPLDFVRVELPDVPASNEPAEQVVPSATTSPQPNVHSSSPARLPVSMPSPPPAANSPFKSVGVKCSSVESLDDFLEQARRLAADRPALRLRWLNGAQTLAQVDLTSALTFGGDAQQRSRNGPLLVLTLAYEKPAARVRLLINGSQECRLDASRLESASPYQGLESVLDAVTACVTISVSNAPLSLNEEQGAAVNGDRFATSVSPLNTYALLYGDEPTTPIDGRKPATVCEEEFDDEDDFERIDMDEFLDDADEQQQLDTRWRDSAFDEQVAQMKTICEECGENDTTKVLLLEACGHAFCSRCLKAFVHQQICGGEQAPTLRCAFAKCSAEIPAHLLLSLFEMPTVEWMLRACAEADAKRQGARIFACPNGCGLARVPVNKEEEECGESALYGHVKCTRCKAHVCLDCAQAPHWPMTCTEYLNWSRRRELQSRKSVEARNEDEEAADEKSASENEIAGQFWTICSEARKRRLDLTLAHKVAKEARKQLGYKLERQYGELRKSALHVVEHAYAWLYMCRSGAARPDNWSAIKRSLAALQDALLQLENAFLYGPSTTSNGGAGGAQPDKAEELRRFQRLLRKTVAEVKSGRQATADSTQ